MTGAAGKGRAPADEFADCKTIVAIVSFRNPEDVEKCLSALKHMHGKAKFAVVICANGGRAAYEEMVRRLGAAHGLCQAEARTLDLEEPTLSGWML